MVMKHFIRKAYETYLRAPGGMSHNGIANAHQESGVKEVGLHLSTLRDSSGDNRRKRT